MDSSKEGLGVQAIWVGMVRDSSQWSGSFSIKIHVCRLVRIHMKLVIISVSVEKDQGPEMNGIFIFHCVLF